MVGNEEFVIHWCPFCGGVSHPATGCEYAENFVACYRCTVEVWEWVLTMTNQKGRRGGRPAFYDHVNVVSPVLEPLAETV